jgi:hypothetical protein
MNGTTSSGISDQMRDDSTYAGAAGKLVHLNGKIEIISFVPKFLPNLVSTTKPSW